MNPCSAVASKKDCNDSLFTGNRFLSGPTSVLMSAAGGREKQAKKTTTEIFPYLLLSVSVRVFKCLNESLLYHTQV